MKKRKSKKSKRRTGGMFIIYLILLVAVIIVVNNVFFDGKNLNNSPKSEYNGPCNIELGGFEVSGECYYCGVADDICPEDFGTVCRVEDPDCS